MGKSRKNRGAQAAQAVESQEASEATVPANLTLVPQAEAQEEELEIVPTEGVEAPAPVQAAPALAPVSRPKGNQVHVTGKLYNGEDFVKDIDAHVTAPSIKKGQMFLNWTFKAVGLTAKFDEIPTAPAA